MFYSAQQCYIDVECAPARLKVRENIDFLTAQELADFRRAVKQALNDKRVLIVSPGGRVPFRLVHGRRGRRAPVLPAPVHDDQP